MTDFLTDYGVVVALGCAGTAVVYGLLITQRLLAKPPGNDLMVEISGAVQEGASAYLKRQYTIIAGVGVVVAVLLIPLQNVETAIGFVIGGVLSGAAGFIGMNLSVRANSRVAEAARGRHPARARHRLQGRLGHRPARRRPGAARRRRLLRRPAPARLQRQGGGRRPDRPRLRRLADLRLRPPRRRHLHQGRRRRRRPGRQDRGRDPRGRSAQPRRDRRQRRRQRRRLRRHGGRPVRDLRRHRGRGDAARRPHLHRRVRARGRDLPAGDRRRRDHRLDRRRPRGADPLGQRRARALPGPRRLGAALGRGLLPDHRLADERRAPVRLRRGRRRGRRQRHRPLALRPDRARRHRAAVRDHRLLHLDPVPAGADDRRGLGDRARDQHHPGARPGLPVHGGARCW